jgi:VWFA-related protein
MRTVWTLVLVAAASAVVAAGRADQGKRQGVVQFPAGLVRVDAIVERELTSVGPVPVLTKDDFEIQSDGVVRPVDYFSADPAPMSLVLLVDVTDSLTLASSPREFRTAMDDFITLGVGPMDRARLGAIADSVYWTSNLTGDKVALAKGAEDVFRIGPAHGQGPSPIWDAVDTAVKMIAEESVWRRRAVIVVSDGLATGNVRGSEEVARDAAAAGISVHTITERALSSIAAYGPGADQMSALRAMSDTTGGMPYVDGYPPAPRNPARFVQRAIDALRHAYTLGFAPVAVDGKTHPIEVIVKKAGISVRTRKMYLAN